MRRIINGRPSSIRNIVKTVCVIIKDRVRYVLTEELSVRKQSENVSDRKSILTRRLCPLKDILNDYSEKSSSLGGKSYVMKRRLLLKTETTFDGH